MALNLKRHLQALSTSSLLHILFFLLIGISFQFSQTQTKIGDNQAHIIASYVYQDNRPQQTQQTQRTAAPKTLPTKKDALIAEKTKKSSENKQLTQTNKPAPTMHSSKVSGEQAHELVALLHAAIQKEQQYPASAMEMERQGRVTLEFTLYPNGTVADLRIAQSSGTGSLDQAALEAIKNAVPFQGVTAFISEAQNFRIDVVFELT